MSTKTEPKDSEKMAVATGTPTAANQPRAAAASRPRRLRAVGCVLARWNLSRPAWAVGVAVAGRDQGADAGRDGARRGEWLRSGW